jgi:hypothetical protein
MAMENNISTMLIPDNIIPDSKKSDDKKTVFKAMSMSF